MSAIKRDWTADDYRRGADNLSLSSKAYPVDGAMLMAALRIAARVMEVGVIGKALADSGGWHSLALESAIREALTHPKEGAG